MPPLPYALGAVALSLTGVISLELRPRAVEDEPAGHVAVLTSPVRHTLDTHGAGRATTVLARPLFSEGRRPAPPPPPGAAAPASLPRLTGTLVGPFGKRALLVDGSGDRPLALGERDRMGAWTVEAISEGHVTLSGPDGARSLRVGFKPPEDDQTAPASSAARRIRRHNRM